MGGCCCSCRKPQLQGAPIFYYYPQALEENESLTSHDSAAVNRSNGYFVGLNLDASSPDTFQCPPTPIPFDVVLGYPPSTDSSSFDKGNYEKTKENFRAQAGSFPVSPKKLGVELCKLTEANASTTEEEDICPTCFEEYHGENPKIITKCNHHYHLSCIFEWMERSDTCPICNQEMDFEVL